MAIRAEGSDLLMRLMSSTSMRRDVLANHWVVDGNLVTGQNQNAAPMVAREMLRIVAEGTTAEA